MTVWKLSPQYKKSAVEKMFFYKDGAIITIEQGFRWGTFTVESDERPLTDEELKNEDGYELGCIANDECWEMWDMIDGCWLDIEAYNSNVTDEDMAAFEAAWEEDSYCGVEELGWSNDDTEYYYHGPLELTNEDTGEVFKGEPDENVSVSGVPIQTEEQLLAELDDLITSMPEAPVEVKAGVTDWFPVSINPVRIGTYEVLTDAKETNWPFPSNVSSSVWNGKAWDSEVAQWRGLTEEAK